MFYLQTTNWFIGFSRFWLIGRHIGRLGCLKESWLLFAKVVVAAAESEANEDKVGM